MNHTSWSSLALTIIALAIGCGQCCAQGAAVEVQTEVEVIVDQADAIEVVAEAVEQVDGEEQLMVAMPADRNLLKLRAYAQVQAALARRVCLLTDEQQKSFGEINDKWVDKIHRGQQQNAVNRRQPGLIAMFFGAQPVANPRQRAKGNSKAQIDAEIAKLLTDEQQEVFEEEKQRRDQFRAEATAEAMIESLQERLGMTDDQREAIKTKLVPWAAKMNMHTMYYFSGNNYYPNVPEHLLSPHLDPDQMTAFRGLQRHIFTDDNFHDGNAPIVIKQ